MRGWVFALGLLATGPAWGQGQATGPTLAAVKARGMLECTAGLGVVGFGLYDKQGVFQGLDADTCRAIAAAVLGEPRVRFTAVSSPQRLTVLQTGQVDVTVTTLTWTLSREAMNGTEFAFVNFYDGQSFLVRKASGVKVATDLKGAAICTTQGSTSELNLADWSRSTNSNVRAVVFERAPDGMAAYEAGRCDAYSTDAGQLAANRTALQVPDDHIVLSERISKEPVGPAVRKGDEQWLDIVKWTGFALVNAEELGVTQANVDEMLKSPSPSVQRLLGVQGDMGKMLGLDNRWAYNAIKAVGNYGEIYERAFGGVGLPRGVNRLWNQGGIMYAPPLR